MLLLLFGFLFQFACLGSPLILCASNIVFDKNGLCFPIGGTEVVALRVLVQIWLVLIGPGALSEAFSTKTRSPLTNWLRLWNTVSGGGAEKDS